MPLNWINANDYTMRTFLLFDRWILRFILNDEKNRNNLVTLAKALYNYPEVKFYIRYKAPELISILDEIEMIDCSTYTIDELRQCEVGFLQYHESFIVYAYPEIMDKVNYIRNWSPENLFRLVDLDDKVVLDLGAGTGRLAFSAATKAKMVYASEPVDQLREYMRDCIKKDGIKNVRVLDGFIESIPYEDNTFDVIMSGHVVGDDYDREIAEMSRVLKDNGWIIICNGDDEFKREKPREELISRGFEWFVHESVEGGIIYDYRKQIHK